MADWSVGQVQDTADSRSDCACKDALIRRRYLLDPTLGTQVGVRSASPICLSYGTIQ